MPRAEKQQRIMPQIGRNSAKGSFRMKSKTIPKFTIFASIINGVTFVSAAIWLARILPAVVLFFEIPAALGKLPRKNAVKLIK